MVSQARETSGHLVCNPIVPLGLVAKDEVFTLIWDWPSVFIVYWVEKGTPK